MWRYAALCAGLWMAPWLAWANTALATVTITDGPSAVLIREASLYKLSEGVRLHAQDMLDTGPQTRLIRLEFGDGATLDLGPDTRVLLSPQLNGDRSNTEPRCYLLHGWAKFSAPSNTTVAQRVVFSAAVLDMNIVTGRAVVAVLPQQTFVFAESGSVTLIERLGTQGPTGHTLKSNQFYARTGKAKSTMTARPSAEFLQQIPRPFLDTLPSRAAAWKEREVQPSALGTITYPQAQPWIDGEAELRPLMLARWKSLAQQSTFRTGLVGNMKAHPEWDRVVFPEKYRPKPHPGDTAAPAYTAPR